VYAIETDFHSFQPIWFFKIDVFASPRQSTSPVGHERCTLVLYILAPEKVLLDSLQEGYFLHIQQLDVCPSICSLRCRSLFSTKKGSHLLFNS